MSEWSNDQDIVTRTLRCKNSGKSYIEGGGGKYTANRKMS